MTEHRPQASDQYEDGFRIVGAGWRRHIPAAAEPSLKKRLRGKPVISAAVLFLIVMGCICAGFPANHDPGELYLDCINHVPCSEFYFGTDALGRDIYSLIWYGGRVSLAVGVIGAAISTFLGITYGCISAVAGGMADYIMMRAVEICHSMPSVLLCLVLSAFFGTGSIVSVSCIIGITGWFSLARMVRSEARRVLSCDYVRYAGCCGAGGIYIALRHLLPNCFTSLIFMVISLISASITMESTLSFLGLGLTVDTVSWGSMLSLAGKAFLTGNWWVIIFPGLFLIVTLICITNIGEYLRQRVSGTAHVA